MWTEETEKALEDFEAGTEDSLKSYLDLCTDRLNKLIKQVRCTHAFAMLWKSKFEIPPQVGSPLAPEVRAKIISLITLDVHGRDVVAGLVRDKVESVNSFRWQSQLRYYFLVRRLSLFYILGSVCLCVKYLLSF